MKAHDLKKLPPGSEEPAAELEEVGGERPADGEPLDVGGGEAAPPPVKKILVNVSDPEEIRIAVLWDGRLDECALFSSALTATQICDICRFGLDGLHADRGADCGGCTSSLD